MVDQTICYTYDGDGDRVATTNCNVVNGGSGNTTGIISEFLYDIDHRLVSQVNPNTSKITRANIYAGGEYLAEDAPDAAETGTPVATQLRITDQVGSLRGRWDYAGRQNGGCTSFPYGDGFSCTDPSTAVFTGKDRDNESALDYFGARYYSNRMGRFTTPDWSSVVEPVPFAILGSPQSLNLYAYVRNSPLSSVDPDGHDGSEEENGDRAWLDKHAPQVAQAEEDVEKSFSGSAEWTTQQPPPVDPPRGANGEKNSWVQKTPSGNGDRDVAWESEFPTNRTPDGKGSKAGASWDPGDESKGIPGHWDIDTGYGNDRRRYLPDGTQIDHWGNPSNSKAGLPISKQVGDFFSDHAHVITGAALITGAILLAPETGGLSLILAF